MYAYLQTFVGVAAEMIAIFISLFIAHQIYLIQKRDEIRISVRDSLREFSNTLLDFSQLRTALHPDNIDPRTPGDIHYLLNKEAWEDNPIGLFDRNVSQLKDKFQKAYNVDVGGGRRAPANKGIYASLMIELNQLLLSIYQEFPVPPTKSLTYGDPNLVQSLINDDFPNNYNQFATWHKRFSQYCREVNDVYFQIYYIIRHIIQINNRIITESKARKMRTEEILSSPTVPEWAKDIIRNSREYFDDTIYDYYLRENEFYTKFFNYFPALLNKSNSIKEHMELYDRYHFSPFSYAALIICTIGLFTVGLVLPFYYMSGEEGLPLLVRASPAWHLPIYFIGFLLLGLIFTLLEVFKSR